MKMKKIFLLALPLVIVLGSTDLALCDGGPAPGPCSQLPAADQGPWITGFFIVARDHSKFSPTPDKNAPDWIAKDTRHYNVHALLKSSESDAKVKSFMFSFSTNRLGGAKSKEGYLDKLCDNTASDFLDQFKDRPCTLKVGDAFKLTGTPVLTEISNLWMIKCGTDDEMIYGEVKIRIVP